MVDAVAVARFEMYVHDIVKDLKELHRDKNEYFEANTSRLFDKEPDIAQRSLDGVPQALKSVVPHGTYKDREEGNKGGT